MTEAEKALREVCYGLFHNRTFHYNHAGRWMHHDVACRKASDIIVSTFNTLLDAATRPTPEPVSDDLVRDILRILGNILWVNHDYGIDGEKDAAISLAALIHRREQQAAEAMRERCAKAAKDRKEYWGNHPLYVRAADDMAKAIRSLTTEEKP